MYHVLAAAYHIAAPLEYESKNTTLHLVLVVKLMSRLPFLRLILCLYFYRGQAKSEETEIAAPQAENSPPAPDAKQTDISVPEQENSDAPTDADNGDYVNPWDLKKLKLLDNTLNWQEMWNPRHSMSITHTKGLLNAPGENNCFLNSAVQVRLLPRYVDPMSYYLLLPN